MPNDDLKPHFEWFAKEYKKNVGSKVSKKDIQDIAEWLMYSWAVIDIVRHEMPDYLPELAEFIKNKKEKTK